jgi:hypothetical protein
MLQKSLLRFILFNQTIAHPFNRLGQLTDFIIAVTGQWFIPIPVGDTANMFYHTDQGPGQVPGQPEGWQPAEYQDGHDDPR